MTGKKNKKSVKSRKTGSAGAAVRKILLTLAFAFVVIVFSVIVMLALVWYMDRAPESAFSQDRLFTISRGEPGAAVTRRLLLEKYIKSDLVFRLIMKIKNYDNELKAGTYRISPTMPGSEILEVFVSGSQVLESVRIPEGTGLRRVAALIEEAGVAKAETLIAAARDVALLAELKIPSGSAEGYLFPDTYFFARDSDAEEIIRVMVKNFRTKVAEAVPEVSTLDAKALHEKIIMASIVEREYRVPEEAARMAGVFYNRIKIGMPLQSCATVVYVITEKLGKPHPSRIFDRDIQLQNPFNTYVNRGLPPAPICNPGMTALTAVIRPETTKYLYFRLVDESAGKHYFSETLDEHIRASSLIVKQ